MDNLQDYVRNNFDGMLVFGDVHAEYDSIERAYRYAESENYFFMSLGDLVDRGRNPYETVKLMHDVIYEGRGGLTIGNHDDKFCRYAKGAKVKLSSEANRTLEDVGEHRKADFLEMYVRMAETKLFSAMFHQFDNISLCHAASHPSLWDVSADHGKSRRSRFIVGEPSGLILEDGMPERLYTWIDEIPSGKTVLVGHDRKPIHNVLITSPMRVTNKENGTAIFLDTGCAKGGFLTGAIIVPTGKTRTFEIVDYIEFK